VSEIVPVISSSVAGPLGVLHLPRLWLKVLLHACGRLPEGYRHGVGGFDALLLTELGLDADAFVAYIERDKPSYLELEAWVRANAKSLEPARIAAFNERVRTARLRDELAVERRARFGLDDSVTGAIELNDLDDWAELHDRVVAAEAASKN
jgi:hypothetical protein